ncbi:EFR1 family ferrodoxin [Ruminococcus flavefaciens]|uniref:EFR1 family ferrodoxin n=1 Tax=Ruminococcus flavefaciens TaxID=1265 RepID=UPI000309192E|nr:EFR1 family ferrodoxin [Ruminococcus flavefaciens]
MVLYFSATGNTRFLATELAKKLDDECLDLLRRIKENDFSEISSEKPFIICAPVYICEMPRFLSKYLQKVRLTGNSSVYFIANSAGYSGITGYLAKRIFRRKKMNFMGHTELVMPRNYYIGHYPVQSGDEIRRRILSAYNKLDDIAADIRNGRKLKARYVFLFEKLITLPFNPIWAKYKMPTRDFFASDNCIGCGKCEKVCPLNNISIKDKKPIWGTSCTHCMACIGNCPTDAIEYGDITKVKGKYNFNDHKHLLGNRSRGASQKDTDIPRKIYKRRKNG